MSVEDRGAAAPSLYYLRTFHAVASERSFTRAGVRLDLSQPAVSAHIRALERSFGSRLFETRQRRVHLTAAGETLFAYTRRIFGLIDDAGRAISATRSGKWGLLRLAASPTLGIYLLPAVLGSVLTEAKDAQVEIAIDTSAEVVQRVLADEVPLGLIEAPAAHRDLVVETVGEDEMVLIAPRGHALAGRKRVTAADLATVPLLRREAGSGTRRLVDGALDRAGVRPPTLVELGSHEALKQAVLAGLGLAWVPHLSVAREVARSEIAVINVSGLAIRRSLSSVHRHDASVSALGSRVLGLVRAHLGADELFQESIRGRDNLGERR